MEAIIPHQMTLQGCHHSEPGRSPQVCTCVSGRNGVRTWVSAVRADVCTSHQRRWERWNIRMSYPAKSTILKHSGMCFFACRHRAQAQWCWLIDQHSICLYNQHDVIRTSSVFTNWSWYSALRPNKTCNFSVLEHFCVRASNMTLACP